MISKRMYVINYMYVYIINYMYVYIIYYMYKGFTPSSFLLVLQPVSDKDYLIAVNYSSGDIFVTKPNICQF